MVRGIEGNEMSSSNARSSKKATNASTSSQKSQPTLFGFFQRQTSKPEQQAAVPDSSPLPASIKRSNPPADLHTSFTPAPSSDAVPSSPPLSFDGPGEDTQAGDDQNGLPSPISPAEVLAEANVTAEASVRSPSRKAKKKVSYAESADEDDDILEPVSGNHSRSSKRRKVIMDDSDDEFGLDAATQMAMEAEDLDDFIVPDQSEDEQTNSKKRKRAVEEAQPAPRSVKGSKSAPPTLAKIPTEDMEIPDVSTAQQWTFNPEHTERINPVSALSKTKTSAASTRKAKAHTSEPEKRYPWLADLRDADRNPPDHPNYDPRTVYIPPMAWSNFSAFEKQYWEIKQKFWDTVVFFKKGKFYEIYENDATIGHQLFDLKLTDRVNMRMAGVPEASLDLWASRFVGEGYKIARVDQMENALGKEMRERDEKSLSAKEKKQREADSKVIRRELTAVLTRGTLVDGGMLQGDMSTYCAAIKQLDRDGLPCFGIAFVDTATARFYLAEFIDDADLTKFETLIAQIRPAELLIEKSCLSAKASRILKNNTTPTTIWNHLKPNKEFWPADITCRELDASAYFVSSDDSKEDAWPPVLDECKNKELLMSAFGALIQYLRTLKIDRELITVGNFETYDPIRKATSLVLDGQSLINLEIFANSFDGGSEGTLFSMVNRCVTPFGKRLLQQWVCHPLADIRRINARLDAVDALAADLKAQDTFTASLTRLPDLERLISRIHAGRCKAQEFTKVLEGFEQIEYTMGLLGSIGAGEGLLGQLVTSMPDLAGVLEPWKTAFDRSIALKDGILVPEPGVEEDFDETRQAVEDCESNLQAFLVGARKEVNCPAIKFKDLGKEIYQLEVPAKSKNIPKYWDQMSSTNDFKRYYTPELRKLVRQLQEARETNAQVAKEVAGRFYARFDEQYPSWIAAITVVSQLDCLISLARASMSLGTPACRPVFVDDERSVVSFTDLRHPTMLTTVQDFIPNSINLGGVSANINLLTGANAAGKSTILRMTCIAVILAQLGCHVPCQAATLTPVDRIMSRLGANDNILQQQSTFFVELAETKKILSDATSRSLVILDELGRGTSSVDGLAVAEAVLHHIAGSVGCTGFFATHYHSLAHEFAAHPEVQAKRMAIEVDDAAKRVTFLYRLEDGVAEGSFGMHCASMCGIPSYVVERAEQAAERWEHSGRVQDAIEKRKGEGVVGLGWLSDLAWMLRDGEGGEKAMEVADTDEGITLRAMDVLRQAIETL